LATPYAKYHQCQVSCVDMLLSRGRVRASFMSFQWQSHWCPSETISAPPPSYRLVSDVFLLQFQQVSFEEVEAAIRALSDKSCALDPLPTTQLKAVADVVVPFLTELFNRSLLDGSVPDVFKQACITPRLKKPSTHWCRVWCYRGWTIAMQCSHFITPCTALAVGDERGRTARCFCVIKVRLHDAAPVPITLTESSMAYRLQVGRSGLEMSSWPGTVIPRWRTSSSSKVGVSKASAFRFVSWTVCFPYPTVNLRGPSFSSRRCTDLKQSSAAYHICSVTSCLMLSLEDIFLPTLLPVIILLSCPRSGTVIYGHVNRSYLLTYLLTYLLVLIYRWIDYSS